MTPTSPSPNADAPAAAPSDAPSVALARAGAVVLVGYVLARGLGYVRLLVYAAIFGAGAELDAFSVAFRLPDLALSLVASGALAAAVAAPMSRAWATGGRESASRTASGLLTWAAIGLALFGIVVYVVAPALVPLLAPGFGPASSDLAVSLSREMAAAPLLLGLGGMVGGILQADRRYAPATLGPIAYNVVSVGSALLLSGALGAHALSVGVVGGSAAYLVVQLPALASVGLRLRPSIDLSEPGLGRAVGLLGPRALGLSVDQLKLVLALAAASTLATGSVTAFAIAYTIFQIPAGILAVPLGTVALPEMASQHALGVATALGRLVRSAMGLVLFLVLPVTALAVGLAPEIADLLFGHGRYDDASVALTAGAVSILFLGLPATSVSAFATRALYATERTGTSVAGATLDLGVMAALLAVLTAQFGLTGIAAAFAAGATSAGIVLLIALVRRVPGPGWAVTLAAGLRSLVLAVIAGAVGAVVADLLLPLDAPPHGPIAGTIVVVAAGLAGGAVYLLGSWRLGAPELAQAVRLIERVRHRTGVPRVNGPPAMPGVEDPDEAEPGSPEGPPP
jgi:putative peptidoglycan lipid II flippase